MAGRGYKSAGAWDNGPCTGGTGNRWWIRQRIRGRKVRSPQSSVPANGRGGSLKTGFTESATENIPPLDSQGFGGKGEKVR